MYWVCILTWAQVQCKVFNTTYNPERLRLGSRILHQRLKGPSVASYYPPRIGTIPQLRSLYPEHQIIDEAEEDWLEHLNVAKSRGKGAPKKKRTAAGRHPLIRLASIVADPLQNPRNSTRGSRRIDGLPLRSKCTIQRRMQSSHFASGYLPGHPTTYPWLPLSRVLPILYQTHRPMLFGQDGARAVLAH